MSGPTSRQVGAAVERQHPDAGVLVLDARGGEGQPRKLAHRPRDEKAGEDVMDMVVALNAPPIDGDPRPRDDRGGIVRTVPYV
jgi:hypothetical protein